jgi:hypothetical protein
VLSATQKLHEAIVHWSARPGDVVWRRRRFRREWFLVLSKIDDGLFVKCVISRSERMGRYVAIRPDVKFSSDPNEWPDEVCAAVAEWRLTHG